MGNRAVISDKEKEVGIYLHWNGGPESICAFLTYAKLAGVRNVEMDPDYFYARLTQIIGNFFGGVLSLGIGRYEHLDKDNGDNGVYFVDENFNVVLREFAPGYKEKQNLEYMRKFLLEIDNRQAEHIFVKDRIDLSTVKFVEVPGLEITE